MALYVNRGRPFLLKVGSKNKQISTGQQFHYFGNDFNERHSGASVELVGTKPELPKKDDTPKAIEENKTEDKMIVDLSDGVSDEEASFVSKAMSQRSNEKKKKKLKKSLSNKEDN